MAAWPRRWCLLGSITAVAAATALAYGCAPPMRVTGFTPPTNVLAFTHPKLTDYPLQRIAILHFDNRTPSPEAGETIAEFFYQEIRQRTVKIILPPLPADYTQLNLEIPLGHRVGGRLPPPKVSPQAVKRILTQLGPALREALEAARLPEPPSAQVAVGSGEGRMAIPSHIRLSDAEKAEALYSARRPPGEGPLVDGLVVGLIGRYRNRQGSPLTVREPASVAYDIYLLSTIDGAVLWQASFDETQVPLFENIMLIDRFVKGKGVWQTHDTLTRIGMARVLETFPGVIRPIQPPPEKVDSVESPTE
jgi:hypothetical protein